MAKEDVIEGIARRAVGCEILDLSSTIILWVVVSNKFGDAGFWVGMSLVCAVSMYHLSFFLKLWKADRVIKEYYSDGYDDDE